MKYIISSHIQYDDKGRDNYGPPHHIFDYLFSKKKKVIFIKHDINGKIKSIIVEGGKSQKDILMPTNSLIKRTYQQILFNVQNSQKSKDEVVFIGVDPINAISGGILKLKRQINKNIYLTADYADRRFSNVFINIIYHVLDRIAIFLADENWAVSTRIVSKRKKQGVSDQKNKLFPNSPFFNAIPHSDYNGNQNIAIVSHLSASLDLDPILQVINKMSRKNKKIHLNIIGTGPEFHNFKKLVIKYKLSSFVTFLGQKSHDEVLKIICKSFIGLAIYSKEQSWNVYGDSMKAREYVACGIPVIINKVPSTSDDVREYNAGLVIDYFNSNETVDFIDKCINDRDFYLSLRKNALQMGKAYDKESILEQLLLQ